MFENKCQKTRKYLDLKAINVLQAIMPLRVLHLEAEKLDYLLQFMDHNEDRDLSQVDEFVVQTIRDEWGQHQYSEDLIRRIEGILDVNTVEHR